MPEQRRTPRKTTPAKKAAAKKTAAKKTAAKKAAARGTTAGARRIRDETTERIAGVDTIVETSEDVETGVSASPSGEPPTGLVHPADTARDPRYLRTLFWLLIAATFFEGYDSAILALVLPGIQDTFRVPENILGYSRGLIDVGLFFAFFLARMGDRVGRRRLLLWSVFGYTVFTTATAFSWNLASFTVFQMLARVFLGAEYAVAVTMIVEEFPARQRASALGRLLLGAACGALVVALLLVAGIASGPLEWRTLYLVGLVPLVILGFLRRRVRETRRFVEYQQAIEAGAEIERVSFWEPWRAEYRHNLLIAGIAHLLRSLPFFGSTAWFFYYAEREAGIDPTALYLMFIAAYGIGIGGYAFCGFLMERQGRRPTAVLYTLGGVVFPLLLFQSRSPALVALFLILGVFFGLGASPLYGAMSTELFPTYIRNQAAAWARNVFEITGFILGPLLVGVLGDHYSGAFGSIGDAVSFLFLVSIPGFWLLWRYLPETQGKELEEIEVEIGGLALEPLTADGKPPEPNGERPPAPPTPRWRVWTAAAIGGASALALVVGIGAGATGDPRPEGAAERFLQGVSQPHEDDRVEEYGTRRVARALRDFERADDDEDWFEHSEVGRQVQRADGTTRAGQARVPFRLVQQDDDETEVFGFLLVREQADGEWKVAGIRGGRPERVEELVPSGGGNEPASASNGMWVGGFLIALLILVAVEAILRLVGKGGRVASAGDVADG